MEPQVGMEEQELSALELRDRIPVPGNGKPELPYRDRAWICNITDLDWPPYYFEYGQFAIKACRQGERFRMTTITARISPMDHGDKTVTTVTVGALHIAHDLVRILNTNSGMGNPDAGIAPFVGLFVCETSQPTEAQLEEAEEKLAAFGRHYVQTADDDWETFRRPAFIPGLARWFAKYLKLDRPYITSKATMIECRYCTANIPARAVICPNCKNILKAEEAVALRAQGEGATPGQRHLPEQEERELGSREQTEEVAKSRRSPSGRRSTKPDSRT